MSARIERLRNTNLIASVPDGIILNDTTAVKVADENLKRTYFEINILPGTMDVCVFIRLYAAGDDNLMRGTWIGRLFMGNNTFFRVSWPMAVDNIYTGEISAILMTGNPDEKVYILEY